MKNSLREIYDVLQMDPVEFKSSYQTSKKTDLYNTLMQKNKVNHFIIKTYLKKILPKLGKKEKSFPLIKLPQKKQFFEKIQKNQSSNLLLLDPIREKANQQQINKKPVRHYTDNQAQNIPIKRYLKGNNINQNMNKLHVELGRIKKQNFMRIKQKSELRIVNIGESQQKRKDSSANEQTKLTNRIMNLIFGKSLTKRQPQQNKQRYDMANSEQPQASSIRIQTIGKERQNEQYIKNSYLPQIKHMFNNCIRENSKKSEGLRKPSYKLKIEEIDGEDSHVQMNVHAIRHLY